MAREATGPGPSGPARLVAPCSDPRYALVVGAAIDERPDPRLVALGLVRELAVEFPPGTVEIDLISTAEDATLPAAGSEIAPPPTMAYAPLAEVPAVAQIPPAPVSPAIPIAPPAPTPPPVTTLPESAILLQADVLVDRRRATLSLEERGLRIEGGEDIGVPWSDVTSIETRRGSIRVRTTATIIDLRLAIDGVAEPHLDELFAQIVREARSGSFDLDGTAAVQLQNAIDPLRERFRDADDTTTFLVLCGAAGAIALILLVALPQILFVVMRPAVPRDAFLLASRLSSVDPRVVAAAMAAAPATAWIIARVALGAHTGPWIRGTLRGWHDDGSPLVRPLRRALALAMSRPGVAASILALGVIGAIPSARLQTTVDPRGVHSFGLFFFQDRDTDWAAVTDVIKVPAAGDAHPDGSAVVVRSGDVVLASTADLRLQNGTDAYFYDMVGRWRGR